MGQRRLIRENQVEIFGLRFQDWAECSSYKSVCCALLHGFPCSATREEAERLHSMRYGTELLGNRSGRSNPLTGHLGTGG